MDLLSAQNLAIIIPVIIGTAVNMTASSRPIDGWVAKGFYTLSAAIAAFKMFPRPIRPWFEQSDLILFGGYLALGAALILTFRWVDHGRDVPRSRDVVTLIRHFRNRVSNASHAFMAPIETIDDNAAAAAEARQKETEIDKRLTTARLESNSLRGEVSAAQANKREFYEISAYGRRLLAQQRSDTYEYAAMITSLQKLSPCIAELQNRAEIVWTNLMARVGSFDPESPLSWLFAYVGRCEKTHASNALRGLLGSLGSANSDPRPFLAGGYEAYRDWRVWLCRLPEMMGYTIEEVPGCSEWLASEAEFFTELKKNLGLTLLSSVGKVIADYDAREGKMSALIPSVVVLPALPRGPWASDLTPSMTNEEFVSFVPGVVVFRRSIRDHGGPSLELTTWFAVFQRSRIANQSRSTRNLTMSFSFRPVAASESDAWIEVPSSNVWMYVPGRRYSNGILLQGLEEETIDVAVALISSNQKALFGGRFDGRNPPDTSQIVIEVRCTARDLANQLERTFTWKC